MADRPYQIKGKAEISQAWQDGHRNVLYVLPTGGGKTKTFSGIIHAHLIAKMVGLHPGPSVAIAHRKELVTQISMALNRDKVPHRIIGPDSLVRECVQIHMKDLGVTFMHPNAKCAVASVQTLDTPKSKRDLAIWAKTVTLWVQDEAHHMLEENVWGRATLLFPNAKGLGVTATPTRADGKGLGRHVDGLFDIMVIGPTMRELIDAGYLLDYRIYAPPSNLDLSHVDISKTTGDYVENQVASAVKKSSIMGDVVEHYLRIAKGKRGITFAPDIESAEAMAERFRQAGVPAMAVSSKNTAVERFHAVRDLASGKLMQLTNVDLFGEGVDIPVVEVTSFARPTESYSLYVQQFGRVLRLFLEAWLSGNWETFTDEVRKQHIAQSSKPFAIIIDHVGNCMRHGLPDAPRKWSLDRREKRAGKQKDPEVIPVRSCPECTAVYERIYRECPYCGFAPIPAGRSSPEQVDGDLAELDAETLARMRGEIAKVNMTMEEKAIELAQKRVPLIGQRAGMNRHRELLSTHKVLEDQLAWWGGRRSAEGMSDSEIQRRFFFRFGIDVLSAQALGRKEAEELIELLAIDNYSSK